MEDRMPLSTGARLITEGFNGGSPVGERNVPGATNNTDVPQMDYADKETQHVQELESSWADLATHMTEVHGVVDTNPPTWWQSSAAETYSEPSNRSMDYLRSKHSAAHAPLKNPTGMYLGEARPTVVDDTIK